MVTKDDVKYIAHLSRIHLDDGEAGHLTKDLEQILGYIAKLQKLDVTNVKPTSHVLPLQNIYREDKIKASLPQADVIKMAVSSEKGSFKVPQVIE